MDYRLDENGNRVRALGLTSGGLDSLLALLIIRNQGIEVWALTFASPFLNPENPIRGCEKIGIPLKVIDFTPDHIAIVKEPRFGHGKNMNPCLDCHSLMFRMAHQLREQEGFHFIFSGEVVGQRPMSQNRGALDLVGRESGAAEYLLRPLSARRLKTTIPEERGWVDRDKLLDFQGRNRKPQMALAEELGLKDYPTPAGGCPLTEPGFSHRLRNLLDSRPEAGPWEMELLRHGRHFELGEGLKLALGRNKADNDRLLSMARAGTPVLRSGEGPGPVGIISGPEGGSPGRDRLTLAAEILLSYTSYKGRTGRVRLIQGDEPEFIRVERKNKAEFAELMIN